MNEQESKKARKSSRKEYTEPNDQWKLLIKPLSLNSTGRNNNIKYVHTVENIGEKPKMRN